MILLSFGSVIIAILAFIFVLGSIVLIHEGGHFYFAHKCGVLCREYAFGMGPRLWGKKKGETTYAINAFPIGGYVSIAGEEKEADPLKDVKKVRLVIEDEIVKKIVFEADNPLFKDMDEFDLVSYDLYDEANTGYLYIEVKDGEGTKKYQVDSKSEYVFAKYKHTPENVDEKIKKKYISSLQIAPYNRQLNSKKIGQRALVMFGGPMMNFVLAILVFIISAFIMGVSNVKTTTISEVSSSTAAYKAGLRDGDRIYQLEATSASGNLVVDTNVWEDISSFMEKYSENDYNEEIIVRYYEGADTSKPKEVSLRPMVLIYSISMYEDINSDAVKIAALAAKSKAYKAGLREGDVIKEVNGATVNTWKDVYKEFKKVTKANTNVSVVVERDGEELTFSLVPYSKKLFERTQNVKYVDIQIGISPTVTRNPLLCISGAFKNMYSCVKQLLVTLWMLITSSEVGLRDLSGVVGIFSLTSDAASNGFGYLLYWMGFLSVNVGFMNLLPIPALDGGRLMFLLIEVIRKKPVSQKVQDLSINITMILLFVLMGYTIINDILRLI